VLLPGLGETLRIRGRAYVTRDPEVLAATGGPRPHADVAVGMEVERAFLHCAKALIRSRLWGSGLVARGAAERGAGSSATTPRSGRTRRTWRSRLATAYRDRLW
jgi:hypothetical protein